MAGQRFGTQGFMYVVERKEPSPIEGFCLDLPQL